MVGEHRSIQQVRHKIGDPLDGNVTHGAILDQFAEKGLPRPHVRVAMNEIGRLRAVAELRTFMDLEFDDFRVRIEEGQVRAHTLSNPLQR